MKQFNEINRENILQFLTVFYGRIRKHKELDGIFERIIETDKE